MDRQLVFESVTVDGPDVTEYVAGAILNLEDFLIRMDAADSRWSAAL